MGKRKILTVIPARGGSKGVPKKNIKQLMGKPLIAHVIEKALKSENIGKLIVSTDDEEIASIAKQYGADVPFIRPDSLASDTITLIHVIKHALNYFDSIGEKYDAVLSMQTTVPLLEVETIDQVIDKFHTKNCLSVATISQIRQGHPFISKKLIGDDQDEAVNMVEVSEGIELYPRQKREPAYYCNGAVFLRDRQLIEQFDIKTNCLGNVFHTVTMDDFESVNIDEEFDFMQAELILKSRL